MTGQRRVVARPTARVIALDSQGRVLLFQIEDRSFFGHLAPDAERPPIFWITPGGGVEAHETFEEAARREPREETGLLVDAIGPCLFAEDILVSHTDRDIHVTAHYFLAHVGGEVSLAGLDALERGITREHRWWTAAELAATTETVYPACLGELLQRATTAENCV